MCGIAGIFSRQKIKFEAQVNNALEIMATRGPDHQSVWTSDFVSIGYNRLQIRGLGKSGRQPIYNECGSIVLLGVGEVYNYTELRKKLENKGHKFTTESDLEVFVHSYEELDYKFANEINGDFTVVIWDKLKKIGILARDSVGVKPLFYTVNNNSLAFASECKGLSPFNIDLTPSRKAVLQYLLFNYPLSPNSFYDNINILPPGHLLIWGLEDEVKLIPYNPLEANLFPSNKFEDLAEYLENSVRLRLLSDVPLGLHLSGGIDSSTVCHFAAKIKKTLPTYTAFYDSSNLDSKFAPAVCREIKGIYNPLLISPVKIKKNIRSLIKCLDGPIMSLGAFTPYFIAERANKDGIKVLLAGQGGDEVFAGYERFRHFAGKQNIEAGELFNACINIPPETINMFLTNQKKTITEGFREIKYDFEALQYSNNPLRQFQIIYMKTFLQELLRIEDHVHMRWSIENRVPLLDTSIINIGLNTNERKLWSKSVSKLPLRSVLEKNFSSVAAKRTEKQQMAINLHNFRKVCRNLLIESFSNRDLQIKPFNYGLLLAIAKDNKPATDSELRLLWTIYNLHIWSETLGKKITI